MSRTVAVIVHALISLAAGAMYFFFVLPRWWELEGDISSTWGMVCRIVTGVLIAVAAVPVLLVWLRNRRPESATPELALRLQLVSMIGHVVCGLMIVFTAISEIWLSLDNSGQWLFGVYGAAAAIGLLAMFAFYLSLVAELPAPPPRPLKKVERKSRWRRRKEDGDDAVDTTESPGEPEDEEDVMPEKTPAEQADEDAEEPKKPLPVSKTDDETEETVETAPATDPSPDDETKDTGEAPEASEAEAAAPGEGTDNGAAMDSVAARATRGVLRNRRPAGKIRRSRKARQSPGGVTVDDE